MYSYKIISEDEAYKNYLYFEDVFDFSLGSSHAINYRKHLHTIIERKLNHYKRLPYELFIDKSYSCAVHQSKSYANIEDFYDYILEKLEYYYLHEGKLLFNNSFKLQFHGASNIHTNINTYTNLKNMAKDLFTLKKKEQLNLLNQYEWTNSKLDAFLHSMLFIDNLNVEILFKFKNLSNSLSTTPNKNQIENYIKQTDPKKGYLITCGESWFLIYYSVCEIQAFLNSDLQHYKNGTHFHFISNRTTFKSASEIKNQFLTNSLPSSVHISIKVDKEFYFPVKINNKMYYIEGTSKQ